MKSKITAKAWSDNRISLFTCFHRIYGLHATVKTQNQIIQIKADKIRKEELLLSIALSEYKQVIFDILTPIVEGAKITLTPIKGNVKDK